MKQATAAKKGFGSASAKGKKRAAVVKLEPSIAAAVEELAKGEQSLKAYLNPKLFDDPSTMDGIRDKLRSGDVVVLPDAFKPEFAEMVHAELTGKDVAWELNEDYFPDGYAHRHHNVYDRASWSQRLNASWAVFADAASQSFISELTGRDCSGDTTAAPSWYKSGDHSLPHTDWVGQRTVAFVWHLSKSWRPEWGGALYWAGHHHSVATYPASFNTLVLFSVTTSSAHFVTAVSPKHEGKRLTFNGWWQSGWLPSADDIAQVEEVLGDKQNRQALTHAQLQAIVDVLDSPWHNFPAEQRQRMQQHRAAVMKELFPAGARAGLEAF